MSDGCDAGLDHWHLAAVDAAAAAARSVIVGMALVQVIHLNPGPLHDCGFVC